MPEAPPALYYYDPVIGDYVPIPAREVTIETVEHKVPGHDVLALPGTVEASIDALAADTALIKVDIATVKADTALIKADIATAKADIALSKADIALLRAGLYKEQTLTPVSGAASWDGEWMDVRAYPFALLLIAWTAVGSTVGTLAVDGTAYPVPGSAPASAIHDITSLLTTLYGTGFTVGATAGAVTVPVLNAFPYLRWRYTRTGGGGASQFTPYLFGRGS